MKKNKIIYWISTGLISLMMLFSAYSYLTNPQVDIGFKHLGFPAYFRVELAIAKLLAAIVIILPAIPVRIKEWAYAGLAFAFVSASIAHGASGDGAGHVIPPLVFLGVLILSNTCLHKLRNASVSVQPAQ